jgi:2-methylfumaryl-CoA isomerase
LAVNGAYRSAVPSPELGDHTVDVLRDRLGLSDAEIGRLTDAGTVA